MFTACQTGNLEQVRAFLRQGFDLEQRDGARTGRTPLYVACKFGRLDIVRVLIHRGADVNVQTADERSTPLHIATKRGHTNVVRELLKNNANVTLRNVVGFTPLHFACCFGGNLEIFKALIDHGNRINLNDKDNFGQTCLHLASASSKVTIVKELINLKVNINETNNKNETALHLIARGCEGWRFNEPQSRLRYKEILELLLNHGIDTSIRNNEGRLAKELTTREDCIELFNFYEVQIKEPEQL